MTNRATHLPVFLLLSGLFVLPAGCASVAPERDVAWLVRHGDFTQAVRVSRDQAQERPNDPELQLIYRRARAAYLLDRGRRALFGDDPEGALEAFKHADEVDPGNPTVAVWIRKTHGQLAEDWLDRAHALGLGDLEASRAAYEKVLSYDPENAKARLGLANTLLLANYRAGQSQLYYRDGVRAFRELLIPSADRAFVIANDLHENQEAQIRRAQTRRLMCEQYVRQAELLEQQGLFAAAKNEFRLAMLADAQDQRARDGFDRMDREARGSSKLDEADMHRRRGDLEKASEALAEAQVLSMLQTDQVSLAESQIEETRLRDLYEQARALEADNRYEDAIEAYGVLLEQVEFYDDAIVRGNTLKWLIEEAQELYAKAAQATTDLEVYQNLRQINVVWPEYRDVAQRLRALEARGVQLDDDA